MYCVILSSIFLRRGLIIPLCVFVFTTSVSCYCYYFIYFSLCLCKFNNGEDLTEGLFQSNTWFSDVFKHVVVSWCIVLVFLDDVIIYTVDVTTYDIIMVRAYLYDSRSHKLFTVIECFSVCTLLCIQKVYSWWLCVCIVYTGFFYFWNIFKGSIHYLWKIDVSAYWFSRTGETPTTDHIILLRDI